MQTRVSDSRRYPRDAHRRGDYRRVKRDEQPARHRSAFARVTRPRNTSNVRIARSGRRSTAGAIALGLVRSAKDTLGPVAVDWRYGAGDAFRRGSEALSSEI